MRFAEFYSTDWIADSILQQSYNRYVNLRFSHGMRRHYNTTEVQQISRFGERLIGNDSNPFFELKTRNNPKSPCDIGYFINSGVLEFIPEVSLITDLDRTDCAIIDLDPKSDFVSFDGLRDITLSVLTTVLNHKQQPSEPRPLRYKLRFSGNRSFHIYLQLDALYKFTDLRTWIKGCLDSLCNSDKSLSYKNVRDRDDYILIDIGALARHRCVRSLWSLHHKTSLVCVPVHNLWDFNRDQAKPEEVLKTGPIEEIF